MIDKTHKLIQLNNILYDKAIAFVSLDFRNKMRASGTSLQGEIAFRPENPFPFLPFEFCPFYSIRPLPDGGEDVANIGQAAGCRPQAHGARHLLLSATVWAKRWQ